MVQRKEIGYVDHQQRLLKERLQRRPSLKSCKGCIRHFWYASHHNTQRMYSRTETSHTPTCLNWVLVMPAEMLTEIIKAFLLNDPRSDQSMPINNAYEQSIRRLTRNCGWVSYRQKTIERMIKAIVVKWKAQWGLQLKVMSTFERLIKEGTLVLRI